MNECYPHKSNTYSYREVSTYIQHIKYCTRVHVWKRLKVHYLGVGTFISGADPGFQVRGADLKKIRAEWREARNFLGYFV